MTETVDTPQPSLYDRLASRFDVTYTRQQGGQTFTFISGAKVVERLNQVLGPEGWGFEIVNFRIQDDFILTHGRLTLINPEGRVIAVHDGVGGCPVKQKRDGSGPLDLSMDFKGAATDALKKAAWQTGVGLYLSMKEETDADTDDSAPAPSAPRAPRAPSGGSKDCSDCGEPITEIKFKNGDVTDVAGMIRMSTKKHGRALCMSCHREANNASGQTAPRKAPAPSAEDLF